MENHNHYTPTIEFKDIDFCISKGRLSKKLTEKMLNNKNETIKAKDEVINTINNMAKNKIENLEKQNAELKSKINELIECVEFYASDKNWSIEYLRQGKIGRQVKNDLHDDGGKKAREILTKHKDLIWSIESKV